jgi:hypothetical protein
MSNFNTANDLASQLVWERYYQSNEPCFKLAKIVFHHGFASEDKVVIENDGQDWAAIASRIHRLLAQGYDYVTLPCEYCGATEFEDVLCCDECDEPILHGYERPGVLEDGEKATYCNYCHESGEQLGAMEEL